MTTHDDGLRRRAMDLWFEVSQHWRPSTGALEVGKQTVDLMFRFAAEREAAARGQALEEAARRLDDRATLLYKAYGASSGIEKKMALASANELREEAKTIRALQRAPAASEPVPTPPAIEPSILSLGTAYQEGRRAAYAHAAEMAREAYQSWPGVWQLDALAAELDDQPAAQAQPVAVLSALRERAEGRQQP